MDLHYSQTKPAYQLSQDKFESPMDLHYSQTQSASIVSDSQFESPMDLHYSQTRAVVNKSGLRLNPLWIYTTLKQLARYSVHRRV